MWFNSSCNHRIYCISLSTYHWDVYSWCIDNVALSDRAEIQLSPNEVRCKRRSTNLRSTAFGYSTEVMTMGYSTASSLQMSWGKSRCLQKENVFGYRNQCTSSFSRRRHPYEGRFGLKRCAVRPRSVSGVKSLWRSLTPRWNCSCQYSVRAATPPPPPLPLPPSPAIVSSSPPYYFWFNWDLMKKIPWPLIIYTLTCRQFT